MRQTGETRGSAARNRALSEARGSCDTPDEEASVVGSSASEPYLERQARLASSARTYPRGIPIAISEAKGIRVKDVEGRTYFDCLAGAGTLALGHNHPVVVEALRKLLAENRPLHTLDLATPVKDRFVEELFSSLPREFAGRAKIQFCGPAGTDAVEAAVKLVKTATRRGGVMSFHGGYHGMTHGVWAPPLRA